MPDGTPQYVHGIRANLGQFCQQLLQVFFVGLTIGLQRNVMPALAEEEFGVPAGSFALLTAFIVSFGFVKGSLNFVAGRLSDRVGRRRILLWGWIAALPIPFMILYAPSWNWIVAANVLLGVNQGFAWSMTVTSKLDITNTNERGLATGFNEFAGYSGVAIAAIATGYLAAEFDPRWALFIFGLTIAIAALIVAYFFIEETLPWARAEAAKRAGGKTGKVHGRLPEGFPDKPTTGQIFALVSFQHRTLSALSQAGCVEKFVDALVWAFFPVYLIERGLTVVEIGWVVGAYGLVWGRQPALDRASIRPDWAQDSHRRGHVDMRRRDRRHPVRRHLALLDRVGGGLGRRHGAALSNADRRGGRRRPPQLARLMPWRLPILARYGLRHRGLGDRLDCRCDSQRGSRILVHRGGHGCLRSLGVGGRRGNPATPGHG